MGLKRRDAPKRVCFPLEVQLRGRPIPISRVRKAREWSALWYICTAAEYFCLGLAVACLGYVAVSWGRAAVFQAYQNWRLDRTLARSAAAPARTAPTKPVVVPRPAIGSVLGRIQIPRLGLSVIVLEGDSDRVLQEGAGHVPSTALPGTPGNVAIAAHRDTFFRPLRNIREGDVINVTTPAGSHVYRVMHLEKVKPTDVQVLRPQGHPTLTLITCYPFYYVGHAPRRFIVQAAEIPAIAAAEPEQMPAPSMAARRTVSDGASGAAAGEGAYAQNPPPSPASGLARGY